MSKIFSVYDSKVKTYLNPIVYQNSGEALRAFETTSKDTNSKFNMYPEDFTLVELGIFDPDTSMISPLDKPTILACAAEFVNNKIEQ